MRPDAPRATRGWAGVSVRSSVDGIDTGAAVNWARGQLGARAAPGCDDIAVTAELIELARAGDGEAFRQLPGPLPDHPLPAAIAFRDGRTYRLISTRANGQLAFGAYLREARTEETQANGLLVLTMTGCSIRAMTRFPGSMLLRFGLPPS